MMCCLRSETLLMIFSVSFLMIATSIPTLTSLLDILNGQWKLLKELPWSQQSLHHQPIQAGDTAWYTCGTCIRTRTPLWNFAQITLPACIFFSFCTLYFASKHYPQMCVLCGAWWMFSNANNDKKNLCNLINDIYEKLPAYT